MCVKTNQQQGDSRSIDSRSIERPCNCHHNFKSQNVPQLCCIGVAKIQIDRKQCERLQSRAPLLCCSLHLHAFAVPWAQPEMPQAPTCEILQEPWKGCFGWAGCLMWGERGGDFITETQKKRKRGWIRKGKFKASQEGAFGQRCGMT